MKLNNKGFALTSIIYMLIVLFLMIMLLILANLAQRKVVLDKIKSDVKENLNQGGILAQNTYTVTFDPTIGQINQTSKQVTYNEPYGELPTPTREGYKFIGWAKQTYDTYNFIRYYDESNVLRISPDAHYQSSENQIIEDRDILIFDVSFSDSTIRSIEIDDKVLDSSKYFSENGRVYGKINIEEAMLKSGTYFFNFIDVNFNEKPTTYTINKFTLIKHDDISTPQTIVTKQENHTLYAMWENQYTIIYNGNGATSGTTSSSIHTYGEPQKLTPNGYEKTGYKFAGWSTSPDDTNIISDDNEYSYDNTEGSGYKNIKQYSIPAPFEEGEVYQLDVDVKGTGNLVTYFHGESGYKRVHTFNSYGTQEYGGDGHNVALLTDEWEHYRVRFTLTSTGDGNVVKYLLFRAMAGNNVQFKNIRFYKVSSTSHAYVDEQSVERLSKIPNDTVNLYAIWKANE